MRDPALQSIPWERLGHFQGRAGNVPRAIRDLTSTDGRTRARAIDELRRSLEHQDSVMQATAVAVPFLVQALQTAPAPDAQAGLLQLFNTLLSATSFQLGSEPLSQSLPSLDELTSEEKLWPPFTSEDEDEAFSEETDLAEDWPIWTAVTHQQILAARPVIAKFEESPVAEVRSAAVDLISRIDGEETRITSGGRNPPPERKKAWWKFW